MHDDTRDFIVVLITTFTIIALLIFGGFKLCIYLDERQCEAHWKDSGVESSYNYFAGCRIKLKDGTWIPSSKYINMKTVN